MKKNKYLSVTLMVCSLIIFIVVGEWNVQNKIKSEKNPIFINEVCSNNYSALKEGEANYPDYIELYNAGEESISLEGYCLSDSKNGMDKSPVGRMVIEPHSYVLIYADDQKAEGHVSFKLNKNGEQLFLISPQGKVIDMVEVPSLKYNTSFSRMNGEKERWERRTATPGLDNSVSERVPDPDMEKVTFSAESGFYEEEFSVSLQSTEGYDIYYTLDGSEVGPDAIKYETPVMIKEVSDELNRLAGRKDLSPKDFYSPSYCVDKAVVIRAAAYDRESGLFSESTSKTYFVGYESKLEYRNFPIISMVTDPDHLFDFEKGIYGNGAEYQSYLDAGGYQDGKILDSFIDKEGNKRDLYMASNAFRDGKGWEREAQIDYFDSDHNLSFSQNIGIRISGESTRSRSHKSLKLYARDIYGDDQPMVFDWNGERREWKDIRLRNGGNESDTNVIKNAFLQSLVEDRNVAVQDTSPCVLFLDGEYWGVYSLTERYTEEWFQKYYGIDQDNIFMIDSGRVGIGEERAYEAYQELLEFLNQTDFSKEENYEELCRRIDVQSFIDFCCINIYVGNQDLSFGRNIAVWRSEVPGSGKYEDGRWRWMVFDLDLAAKDAQMNSFDESVNDLMKEPAVKNLMKNEQFRERFKSTFLEIAEKNFAPERVSRELDQWCAVYKDQIIKTQRQFVSEEYNEELFEKYMEEIRQFFEQRPKYIFTYLENYIK